MDQDAKNVLKCGIELRNVLTEVLGLIELARHASPGDAVGLSAKCALHDIVQLLHTHGLYETPMLVDPRDNESLEQSAHRIFGSRIFADVYGKPLK